MSIFGLDLGRFLCGAQKGFDSAPKTLVDINTAMAYYAASVSDDVFTCIMVQDEKNDEKKPENQKKVKPEKMSKKEMAKIKECEQAWQKAEADMTAQARCERFKKIEKFCAAWKVAWGWEFGRRTNAKGRLVMPPKELKARRAPRPSNICTFEPDPSNSLRENYHILVAKYLHWRTERNVEPCRVKRWERMGLKYIYSSLDVSLAVQHPSNSILDPVILLCYQSSSEYVEWWVECRGLG